MIDNYHFSKSHLQCCTNHLVSVLKINYMITLFMTFVYWEVGKRWQGTGEIKIFSHLDIIHICINDCLRIRGCARIKWLKTCARTVQTRKLETLWCSLFRDASNCASGLLIFHLHLWSNVRQKLDIMDAWRAGTK